MGMIERKKRLLMMQKNNGIPDFQPTEYLFAPDNYLFTGITTQTGIEMECNIMRQNLGSGAILAGGRPDGQHHGIYMFGFNGTAAIGAEGWINDGSMFASNTLVKIQSGILSNRQYLIIDGDTRIDQSNASNFSCSANLMIGGLSYNNGQRGVMIPNITYYPHFKLWFDGTLVRDYIPGYRKSDNSAGFYDLVGSICADSNTPFYPFLGTGTITFGQDI